MKCTRNLLALDDGEERFRDEQMAPLFADANELPNVVLPKSFVQVIK